MLLTLFMWTTPWEVFSTAGAPVGYGEYFFPGVLVWILLFTAIFTTISVIADRREGFLQAVRVALPAVVHLRSLLGDHLAQL